MRGTQWATKNEWEGGGGRELAVQGWWEISAWKEEFIGEGAGKKEIIREKRNYFNQRQKKGSRNVGRRNCK